VHSSNLTFLREGLKYSQKISLLYCDGRKNNSFVIGVRELGLVLE
jgi:hypothetical protein